MASKGHYLSEIDDVGRTAVCAKCGPVAIYVNVSKTGATVRRCKGASLVGDGVKRTTYREGEHRVLEKDADAQVGVCFTCGDTDLIPRKGRLICKGSRDAQRHRRHKLRWSTERLDAYKKDKSCEVCGSDERLFVDHKHGDSVPRGVLCHVCNSGIGMFRDSPNLLLAALKYLQKHE